VAAAKVKSVASRRFWELFDSLPADVQKLAVKNYELWQRDPQHPSLRFRRLKGSADRFTVRIGDHCRALGRVTADAPEDAQGLENARPSQLKEMEISPSGFGHGFPALACTGRRPLYTGSAGGLLGVEVVDGDTVGADGGPGDEQSEEGGVAGDGKLGGRPRKVLQG
jgi:hypothetical protein